MKKRYYSVVALAASSAILLSATPAIAQDTDVNSAQDESTKNTVGNDNRNKDAESKDTENKEKDENLLSVEKAVDVSDKSSYVEQEELPEVERTSSDNQDFISHIYVSTETGVKTVVVKDSNSAVEEVLEKEGVKPDNLRSATGERVDFSGELENNSSLVLFSDKTESAVEDVELSPSVEIIKDPDILKGEREVVEKGETGKAIKTTVSKVNKSLDKAANKDADIASKKKEVLTKKDESLNIVKAPKKRIVKIGTKEIIEAAEDSLTQARTAMDRASSDVQRSVAQGAAALDTLSSVDLSKLDGARAKVVALAFAQIGKPYVWGAAGPSSFDCSGLVQWIFNDNLGYSVPRVAADQGMASTPIAIGDLEPGDILWTSGHIGIYIGNGEMVHAPSRGSRSNWRTRTGSLILAHKLVNLCKMC